jgi:hypothetical protein
LVLEEREEVVMYLSYFHKYVNIARRAEFAHARTTTKNSSKIRVSVYQHPTLFPSQKRRKSTKSLYQKLEAKIRQEECLECDFSKQLKIRVISLTKQ